MTDIRKHGFESDAQWREHLEEIEQTPVAARSPEVAKPVPLHELAALRRQVDALRARVHAQVRNRRQERRWRTIGAGMLFLLLMASVR